MVLRGLVEVVGLKVGVRRSDREHLLSRKLSSRLLPSIRAKVVGRRAPSNVSELH